MMRRGAWLAAAALAAAAAPQAARAQGLTFAGGIRAYDGYVESALVASVRSEFPIGSAMLLELSSSLADIPAGSERAVGSTFEVQLQFPVEMTNGFAPYFGAGVGVGYTSRFGRNDGLDPVVSIGAGVRTMFSPQLGLALDARLRSISLSREGEHSDVTLGLRYVLGASQ